MQLSEIKMLFENGVLRDAYILPLFDSWVIEFTKHAGESIALEAQRGGVRRFKTIDAAYGVVREIGFQRVQVREVMP